MKNTKHLARAQIHQYHECGYCAPIDVMSEDEALVLAGRLEQVERKFPGALAGRNRNNAHLVFRCMDEIAFNRTILDIVEDLIGPNILLWGSVLFIKEPETEAHVSWHQDAAYMGLEPHDFVTPWLALSPSNPKSGCLRVIPASHHAPLRQHRDTFAQHNILTRGQTVEVDETRAVDLVLRPGQASCHHPRIIHGSKPNSSQQRRIGVALQSCIAPHVRQTRGDSYAILARGEDHYNFHTLLTRPRTDAAPENAARRTMVNQELAKILYRDAEKSRDF